MVASKESKQANTMIFSASPSHPKSSAGSGVSGLH